MDLSLIKNYENIATRYGKILINPNDNCIYTMLKLQGEWESHLLNIFNQLVHPGDIVLDLGAYVGTHSVFLSTLVGPDGKVYSFEPYMSSYIALVFNLLQNKCNNAISYNYAIGKEEDGKMYLPDCDETQKQNMGAMTLQNTPTTHPVQVKTLDQLFHQQLPSLRLIKIDCESMELDVIIGALKLIQEHKPILIIEIHYENREVYSGIDQHLFSNDYTYKQQLPSSYTNYAWTWDFLYIHESMIENTDIVTLVKSLQNSIDEAFEKEAHIRKNL